MGLERIAALLQGTHDNYQTDHFKKLISSISEITKVNQSENNIEKYEELRSNVISNKGEDRVRSWLISFIQEPSFDNNMIKMASVNANQADSVILADYLLKQKAVSKNSVSNNKIKVF